MTPELPCFCYIEVPALDAHASAAFYESVFGWNIRHRDSARPSFDDAAGRISGAFVTGRPASAQPGLLPYIWVADIASTLVLIQTKGGDLADPPHLDHEPDGEWIATFRDIAGNLLGLYQEREH